MIMKPDLTLPRRPDCDYHGRENGHYIDGDGDEVYVQNGKYHRTDGPAIIFANEFDSVGWRLYGMPYTFDNYVIEAEWTDEQIVEWKLIL